MKSFIQLIRKEWGVLLNTYNPVRWLFYSNCLLFYINQINMKGWIKSVFLSALKKSKEQEKFREAMAYLKSSKGLDDPIAWKWVNSFFEIRTNRVEMKSVSKFVNYVYSKLDGENSSEVLGYRYNRKDAYGPFMQSFGGFVSSAETENDNGGFLIPDAASVVSEMFQIKDKGPEVVGTIFRSTVNTQDLYTNQILIKLAKQDMNTLIQLLDQELYFVPSASLERFKTENRFVFLILIRNMLISAPQDNSTLSSEIVATLLNGLDPRSIAVLIQYMWHNSDEKNRFSAIEYNLLHMMELIEEEKYELIFKELQSQDKLDKTKIKRWVDRVMGNLDYSDTFWDELKENFSWKEPSTLSKEEVQNLLTDFKRRMINAKDLDSSIADTLRVLEEPFKRLTQGTTEEMMLSYGKVRMEIKSLLKNFKVRFDENELSLEQKEMFLFQLLEPSLDRFYQNIFEKTEEGISGFKATNSSRKVLRVKVFVRYA